MFWQLLLNTLIVASGYVLMAMAFRIMFSVSPFFNMTIGTVAVIGAYLFEIFIYKKLRSRGVSSMI